MAKKGKKKDRGAKREKRRNTRTVQQAAIVRSNTPQALEESKRDLDKLFDIANDRISQIYARGYHSYAVDKLTDIDGDPYFSLDRVNDKDDVMVELHRVRGFLNDKASTVEGAFLQTAQISAEEYKGAFGNQYNNEENQFAHYDRQRIDDEVAKRAFKSYRKIEEHRAAEIVMDGAYGSENLIIALYDAEIRGMDSLEYGEDLLDTFAKEHEEIWGHVRQGSDEIESISGKIESTMMIRGYR